MLAVAISTAANGTFINEGSTANNGPFQEIKFDDVVEEAKQLPF